MVLGCGHKFGAMVRVLVKHIKFGWEYQVGYKFIYRYYRCLNVFRVTNKRCRNLLLNCISYTRRLSIVREFEEVLLRVKLMVVSQILMSFIQIFSI